MERRRVESRVELVAAAVAGSTARDPVREAVGGHEQVLNRTALIANTLEMFVTYVCKTT